MTAPTPADDRVKPHTAEQKRTFRWAASQPSQRPVLEELERTLLRTAEGAEQDARVLRANAKNVRDALDAEAGSIGA